MVIKPRIRGFICTTAHPVGCAAIVDEQIEWTRAQAPLGQRAPGTCWWSAARRATASPRASSPRSAAAPRTIGLSFEKEPEARPDRQRRLVQQPRLRPRRRRRRDCTPVVRRRRVFRCDEGRDRRHDQDATSAGSTCSSTAWRRRCGTDPDTGVLYRSAIKPVGRTVHIKTLNVDKGVVHEVDLAPATRGGDRGDRQGDGRRGLGALGERSCSSAGSSSPGSRPSPTRTSAAS